MSDPPAPDRHLPSRGQALIFQGKASLLRLKRSLEDMREPVSRHPTSPALADTESIGSASSDLWTQKSDAEFPLTAGKIQNLRLACRELNGIAVQANTTFSFWKQLGRVTRSKGYIDGRELREGCLVPSIGGGLCQLSNMLYSAALDAELEIVERHAHSRTIPGSLAEQGRDATVFWNYVDLRFRAPFPFRLETILTDSQLIVRIRSTSQPRIASGDSRLKVETEEPVRSAPSGDCLTCGMTSCFRNPAATASHQPDSGHCAFLLDEFWPEFQMWANNHSHEGDHWLMPIDGHQWNKPNYAWTPPDEVDSRHATLCTLTHAYKMRRLPAQGAIRQRTLLKRDEALAKHYGRALDPAARHLIVSQNLLPHLWKAGRLGGRTFDVLMTRWPMRELQHRLDLAAKQHPDSPTLSDFRADPELTEAEDQALAAAARLITPHRAIAGHFGSRSLLLDWTLPSPAVEDNSPSKTQIFFPASPLGRKGVYELAAALSSLEVPNWELIVLGRANEDSFDPLRSIPHRKGNISELKNACVVVIPAWIEHQPRPALRALANGIPVVATAACGLPENPQLIELEEHSPHLIQNGIMRALEMESMATSSH